MANNGKFINLENGKLKQNDAIGSSAGVGDAGKVVKLDGTGRLDVSFLPVGVGPDVKIVASSENFAAGDYVNLYEDTGVTKARLADASNGRTAHGFVKAATTSPANATVFFEGPNENLSGLTIGERVYLDTVGQVTQTPRTTGIHQFLGVAIAATQVNTDIDDIVEL